MNPKLQLYVVEWNQLWIYICTKTHAVLYFKSGVYLSTQQQNP